MLAFAGVGLGGGDEDVGGFLVFGSGQVERGVVAISHGIILFIT